MTPKLVKYLSERRVSAHAHLRATIDHARSGAFLEAYAELGAAHSCIDDLLTFEQPCAGLQRAARSLSRILHFSMLYPPFRAG